MNRAQQVHAAGRPRSPRRRACCCRVHQPQRAAAAIGRPAPASPAPVRPCPRSGSTRSGTPPGGPKVAYVMLPRQAAAVSFTIVRPPGRGVPRPVPPRTLGSWNPHYPARLPARLQRADPGRDLPDHGPRGRRDGGLAGVRGRAPRPRSTTGLCSTPCGTSPPSATARTSVPSVLDRQPANLTDARANVYAYPATTATTTCSARCTGSAARWTCPAAGSTPGGGYEKFAYTASYADGLMLLAARDFPGSYPTLQPEADFGLSWLEKLWNPGRQGGLHPGRHRHRQREQHHPGRLQLLVPAAGRGPHGRQARRPPGAHRVLREVPAGVRGCAARAAGSARTSPGGSPPTSPSAPSWRRGHDRAQRRAPAGAGSRRLRHGADQPRRGDRDRVPARLLPGQRMGERHALGRLRDRARAGGARRARRAGAGRAGRGGALGEGVPGAGPQARRRHPQPVRHRGRRRGRAAAGDAAARRLPGHRPGHAARRHGRAAPAR